MADASAALVLAQGTGAGGPGRLPRGRHKLDPAQVVASQRARLFSAMASVTASKGYAATTVADLLAAAGVSRETFYEQFRSKLDCFEQAFEDAGVLLFAVVAESATGAPGDRPEGPGSGDAGPTAGTAPAAGNEPTAGNAPTAGNDHGHDTAAGPRRADRFERFLGAYLDTLASYPDLARLCLVEVYAAGPTMARRRAEVQEQFAIQLEALFGARDDEERFACRALVAAIGGMVTARLAVGDLDGLRALREPIATLVRRALG